MFHWIKRLEHLELHHKLGFFLSVMFLTILVIRVGVQFYNPNPFIFGVELHHFDYGLFLLILTLLLSLFGSRRLYPLCLALAAFSLALVIDEANFIRVNVIENVGLVEYNSTLVSVLIFLVVVAMVLYVIHSFFMGKGMKVRRTNLRRR